MNAPLDLGGLGDDAEDVGPAPAVSPAHSAMMHRALAYAARGLPVFPCNPRPGKGVKAPLVKGGFKAATTDETTIRRWWAENPNALIGMPMGPKTGMLALDPDAPKKPGDADGVAAWDALLAEHGGIPPTRCHMTPGGGRHVLFAYPAGRKIGTSEGALAGKGINVRGDGGYVIMPPSCLDDGRAYTVADPAYEGTLAEAPEWLLDLITGSRQAAPQGLGPLPAHLAGAAAGGIVLPEATLSKPKPKAVAEVCPTFWRMLKDAPSAGERIWWKTIELAMHTTGGAELAHEAASRHPDYEHAETQTRIDRHLKGGFGPPTCGTLQGLYGETSPCLSCPYRGTPTTSPVFIARREAQQAVAATGGDVALAGNTPRIEDFVAYAPDEMAWYIPHGKMWKLRAVDKILPLVTMHGASGEEPRTLKPSDYLMRHRRVTEFAWHPGQPQLIRDCVSIEGEIIDQPGSVIFNLYRPPQPTTRGDPALAGPWIDHVALLFPDERDAYHVTAYLAHRVQRPHEKINHALVLAGVPGIGKDTILKPLEKAVGPGNFKDISPTDLFGSFTSFMQCIVLRINEIHDLGDKSRYDLYEKSKTVIAAPPDFFKLNEKYMTAYYCPNVCSVIMTTNDMMTMHLVPNDRRHYIAASPLEQKDVSPEMFGKLNTWYETGGFEHVEAYLRAFDLAAFNPKASPRKTDAFRQVVAAGRAPEADEMASTIEAMGNPSCVTLDQIRAATATTGHHELGMWLDDRKNRGRVGHRLREAGYTAVLNDTADSGLWRIEGQRVKVYARADLTEADRHRAATALAAATPAKPVGSPRQTPLSVVK